MEQLSFQFHYKEENWDRLYSSYRYAKPRYIDQVRNCMLKFENEKSELEAKYRLDLQMIRANFEERTKLKTVLAPACRHPHNEIMVLTVHGTNEINTITCTLCGKKNP